MLAGCPSGWLTELSRSIVWVYPNIGLFFSHRTTWCHTSYNRQETILTLCLSLHCKEQDICEGTFTNKQGTRNQFSHSEAFWFWKHIHLNGFKFLSESHWNVINCTESMFPYLFVNSVICRRNETNLNLSDEYFPKNSRNSTPWPWFSGVIHFEHWRIGIKFDDSGV